MSALLTETNVFLGVRAADRDAALAHIARRAVELGYATDADDILAGLLAREAEGTTGLMDGIAIPHAKRASISEAAIIVMGLESPVKWGSLDGAPISLAIALLVPEAEAGTTHLRLLSQVARTLMNKDVRTVLTTATEPGDIVDALAESLQR